MDTQASIRQIALSQLANQFQQQGHAPEAAQQMATLVILRADFDLMSAQLSRLLAWLEVNHPALHQEALDLAEATRKEFEQRVQLG
ncbi:hypothetical protein [Leptolyngbya sp. FACHB-261]|uniref:hypothetical protein n=1 Tax=Leptolyngbya sp. FACHB-261 TaxID=2692806 RepID=UPI00168718E0|nr:hypothetical protein [Leptolyngbya sp. FACHB-261]MBD2104656.1 hypothetical protein [Leptolyngbya sp. FACHB-261]